MASSTNTESGQDRSPPPPILPLEQGDHLTREEFERRYEAMPHLKKAELIEGVVYMPSPVSQKNHGNPHFKLTLWTGFYVLATPGIDGGDNSSIKLDDRNEPQPDLFLYALPAHGGRVRLDDQGYVVGAPEVVAEVAASRASYDLHVKRDVYRRFGVKEYIVWRVLDGEIDWFLNRGDQFERLPLSPEGFYQSEVFPGLWLDPQALIAGDLAKVQQVVQRGLASPEHVRFAEQLARASART
jgi:Uma2 family endonuclease